MQWVQACSLIGALLHVRIGQQAMGATENGAIETGATVVIHVGPPKTATKSVQSDLFHHASLLERDGWELVGPEQFGTNAPHYYQIKVANVGSCYTGIAPKAEDWVQNKTEMCLDWLHYIAELKDTTKKVVMSSENFAAVVLPTDVARLAYDLHQVKTIIVMVYRPFYDWVASVYRQKNEKTYSSMGFVDWLSDSEMQHRAYNDVFTTSVYRRYALHFSDIRVHTLGPSLMANIACDDLRAQTTCASFRKSSLSEKHIKEQGESVECLSPAQRQQLLNISMELHSTAWGLFGPPFPTSDFHDKALSCFGCR